MFVGAINSTVRNYLAKVAPAFDGRNVIVGCSGNFTSEAVIAKHGHPLSIHSNDISLYSCMLGRWFLDRPLTFEIVGDRLQWVEQHWKDDTHKMASLMVLLNMLQYYKRNNPHQIRMWALYKDSFSNLMLQTIDRLDAVKIPITGMYEGDVNEHFRQHADDERAVFCCYAPTYAGGYEALYKVLDSVTAWDEPSYPLLGDDQRDDLFNWMTERNYLWYDDRKIDGLSPVMEQDRGLMKTVYLYSNFIGDPGLFRDMRRKPVPNILLMGSEDTIEDGANIELVPIKTTDLALFKDAYLSKKIDHAQGTWAFAVSINDKVVGFVEFARHKWKRYAIYLFSDFPIWGTRYKRLSKLMVMLAISGETRQVLERLTELRAKSVMTTAFTDRPVSMKYRGVLKLVKRGETEQGQKFLNYEGEFTELSWRETLDVWLNKHGSKQY